MRGALGVLVVVLVAACSKDDASLAGPGTDDLGRAARVEAIGGNGQVAAPGAQLGEPLVVRVLDSRGTPVRGIEVSWAASNGADVRGALLTDSAGTARARWTLANLLGRQTVTASVPNVDGAHATFVANDGAALLGSVLALAGTIGGFATSVGSTRAFMRTSNANDEPQYARDRIVVSFRDGSISAARVASRAFAMRTVAARALGEIEQRLSRYVARDDVQVMNVLPVLLSARLRVIDTARADAILADLRRDPDVVEADFEKIVTRRPSDPADLDVVSSRLTAGKSARLNVSARTVGPNDNVVGQIPNDTGFFRQAWHYNMIDAPRAWTVTRGDSRIIVAVIDDGIKRLHPALAPNVTNDGFNFVSPDTTPVTLCGGGGGAYIEPGWGPNPDPRLQLIRDGSKNCYFASKEASHGTHVGGTIAAASTASQGGLGVAPNVRIRAVRMLSGLGGGRSFDLAAALIYAAGIPFPEGSGIPTVPRAHVINMSISGGFDSLTARAISAVVEAGSLLIASSGNDQAPQSSFPAAYPGVISVSSIAPDWQLSSFSNIGSTVRLAAPGGELSRYALGTLVPRSAGIYSSTWNYVNDTPSYAFYQGTSMASPHVAGVAALVYSVKPSLTASEVAAVLFQSATDMGTLGRDDRYGYGVVNAYRAVKLARDGALENPRTFVRVIDAATSQHVRTVEASADGSYVITGLAAGDYHVFGGQDEGKDGLLGLFGRRLGAAGSFARPTTYRLALTDAVIASMNIGLPQESEPNDHLTTANKIFVGSYVAGRFNSFADSIDVYRLQIPAANTYTLETAGALGSCAYALDADTYLVLTDSTGRVIADNDDAPLPWGHFCSRITQSLNPGLYYVAVIGVRWSKSEPPRGQYRLGVREGS